ncbi:unnamed protein product [Leuciscus chuanchicus]
MGVVSYSLDDTPDYCEHGFQHSCSATVTCLSSQTLARIFGKPLFVTPGILYPCPLAGFWMVQLQEWRHATDAIYMPRHGMWCSGCELKNVRADTYSMPYPNKSVIKIRTPPVQRRDGTVRESVCVCDCKRILSGTDWPAVMGLNSCPAEKFSTPQIPTGTPPRHPYPNLGT